MASVRTFNKEIREGLEGWFGTIRSEMDMFKISGSSNVKILIWRLLTQYPEGLSINEITEKLLEQQKELFLTKEDSSRIKVRHVQGMPPVPSCIRGRTPHSFP